VKSRREKATFSSQKNRTQNMRFKTYLGKSKVISPDIFGNSEKLIKGQVLYGSGILSFDTPQVI